MIGCINGTTVLSQKGTEHTWVFSVQDRACGAVNSDFHTPPYPSKKIFLDKFK